MAVVEAAENGNRCRLSDVLLVYRLYGCYWHTASECGVYLCLRWYHFIVLSSQINHTIKRTERGIKHTKQFACSIVNRSPLTHSQHYKLNL